MMLKFLKIYMDIKPLISFIENYNKQIISPPYACPPYCLAGRRGNKRRLTFYTNNIPTPSPNEKRENLIKSLKNIYESYTKSSNSGDKTLFPRSESHPGANCEKLQFIIDCIQRNDEKS